MFCTVILCKLWSEWISEIVYLLEGYVQSFWSQGLHFRRTFLVIAYCWSTLPSPPFHLSEPQILCTEGRLRTTSAVFAKRTYCHFGFLCCPSGLLHSFPLRSSSSIHLYSTALSAYNVLWRWFAGGSTQTNCYILHGVLHMELLPIPFSNIFELTLRCLNPPGVKLLAGVSCPYLVFFFQFIQWL